MNFRKRTQSRRNSTSVFVSVEKWKQVRKFSQRDSRLNSTDANDVDDEPEYYEIKDWVEEFFKRKSAVSDSEDQDIEVKLNRKQTLILATLVPDEILLMERFDSTEPKRFVGVLLMADVSGYTALSERYCNTGKSGTYRLTVTLNTFLGGLIELIYSYGGDILKFAGDAFLALWKTDKKSYLTSTIHTVITCALVIQHSYASYETDVKVNLKVKLAISAGNLIFVPIGHGIDMNYIVIGLPVLEAKAVESVCASGEVKLSATAWGHCYSRNYDHIVHDDGHVTIKSILYDPNEQNIFKPFTGFAALVSQIKKPYGGIESLPDFLWETPNAMNNADIVRRNEALNLRKTILLAEERSIGSEIRKFMKRPVLTQIDAHQPLEYLTEMRQVSVLFLTLKPRDCPHLQLITIVNNAYEITCEIVYKSMGCVNKIILFDKDVMILVIFGLRGFKHESEAQAALKCAYSIKKSIAALDGVREVSVGVTTGPVYCGVIGHPLRREFTVIGGVVNKAARLMCCFRNKITCDETTFVKSKMSSNAFTLQPNVELKGIGQPGKIYEYSEEVRVDSLYDIPVIAPLLNRNNEMGFYETWLSNHLSYTDFDALLLIGDARIGKTRLMQWMARTAKNKGFQVCLINLTSVHSATPYLALSQIMNKLLRLQEPITGFEKEEKIVQLLKIYSEDLCYLNHIIKVRFAYYEGKNNIDENSRIEKAKAMFDKLIEAITETHIIFLDDLQNLDSSSWDFITLLFKFKNILTVLSVTRGKYESVQNWLYGVFINNSIRKIVLGPLASVWVAPLACQILNVHAVPKNLCDALETKCRGNPGLIENFIIHLFSNGAIELKEVQESELKELEDENLQFPTPELLHPKALKAEHQLTLDEFIKNDNVNQGIGICVVTKVEELKTDINVQNIDALVMIQIDSLTPYQQLLLKIASVIGNVLSRDLLENIMYENDLLTTAKALKRLFAMKILSCANSTNTRHEKRNISIATISSNNREYNNLVCDCDFDFEENDNLPKYAFCKLMKFRNKNTRKTCYELLPINQKKEFHSRIVFYLENNEQKCADCGGTITLIQSKFSLISKSSTLLSSYTKLKNSNTSSEEEQSEIESPEELSDSNSKGQFNIKTPRSGSENRPKGFVEGDSNRTTSDLLCYTNGKKTEVVGNITNIASILRTKAEDNDVKIHRRSTKRVTMSNSLSGQDSKFVNGEHNVIFDKIRAVIEAKTIEDWQNIGVRDSKDDLNEHKCIDIKLEKGMSKVNFSKCSCADLKITIYEQLTHHALQAELKSKAVDFMIKCSYFNLLVNNYDAIFPQLADAEAICEDKSIPENLISAFERRRFLGKIYSLRAAVLVLSGRLEIAKLEIDRAIRIYRINLDKVTEYFKFRSVIMLARKNKRSHIIQLKTDSVFCLNVATVLYSSLGDNSISRISAFRALAIIQNVQCNITDICDALSNAIQIELDRDAIESATEVEKITLNLLKQFPRPIKLDELFALGKLFTAIFRVRMVKGNLPGSVLVGFKAITISRFLQADNVSMDIIPDLFYILLSRCRVPEAINIAQLSIRLHPSQATYDSETWYYALCIDLILDAGFELESPFEISRYAECTLLKGKRAGSARRRLVVGLWTYWLRANFEKKAKRFENEALSWAKSVEDDGTLTSLLSALRLADGMLESLASKMDDLRKVVDMMELRSIADRELTNLEKDARLMRTIYPRWILLKANSLRLSGRTIAATNTFNQAMNEAIKINNRLEESLAKAALTNSVTWAQSARSGRFLPWQMGSDHAKTSWHQLLYRITTTRHQ